MRLDDNDMEFNEKRRRRKASSGFSIEDIRDFVIDHYQYFGVGILFVCLCVILMIFSNAVKDEVKEKEDKNTSVEEQSGYEVPEADLEVDAYPEVNALVDTYFKATASGDTATLESICSNLDEKEAIRIEKKAEYTEKYSNFTCYTKPGPEENSYIVFAYYEIKFKNIDTLAPGLTSLYVKSNADGSLYIYNDELSDEESDYVKAIAAQKDVVELLNTVDQKYSEALSSDETLKNFMDALPTAVDDAVEAELANRESAAAAETEEQTESEDSLTNFEVKSTDNVNVRSTPSTDGEKLGQLLAGDKFTCIEAMANGWSKIDFQGNEAYVKTEFIERVNEDGTTSPIVVESAGDEQATEGGEAQNEDNSANNTENNSVSGKVKVNETVRVRSQANTDCEVLGQAYGGETYELIGEENGFSKIKYNGKTGYIRSDYVTKQ